MKCFVEICCISAQNRVPNVEPMIISDTPDYPREKVGCDLLKWKSKMYRLFIDYFSRYIEIALLRNSCKAQDVIMRVQSVFARHDIPRLLISDNSGPPFNSFAFQSFAQNYGFEHVTSSPYFPQGNAEAEKGVKMVKRLLQLNSDLYIALVSYRNPPLKNGFSTPELLIGRKLRTMLPVLPKQLLPK